MNNDQIVFIYDHFYPDFSSGGPVTSLFNLAQLLKGHCNVKILTSAYEYRSGHKMTDIKLDCWTDCKGLPVWYASDRLSIKKALESLTKDRVTLYLNGMFTVSYFLYPLWLAKKNKFKTIVSPRGMLQNGAWSRGILKKEVYLKLIKSSGLLRNVTWHATDIQESKDIKWRTSALGNPKVIPNIPLINNKGVSNTKKQVGELHLVYFSLIAEKKNLQYLIDLLNSQDLSSVQLTIIGPVKDKAYWNKCLGLIHGLGNPDRVKYIGEVTPDRITSALPEYHALALPTLGENFGHAIVEMLACSRPVIISNKTPWNDVEEYGAGYSLELDKQKWEDVLREMMSWNQQEFDAASNAAFNYYQSKFNFDDLKMRYLNLFSNRS